VSRMKCSGHMTARCDGESLGHFRLSVDVVRPLCGACLEAATALGYAPERVPQWVGRALERRLAALDLTGQAA
jgi:hypothetical protein